MIEEHLAQAGIELISRSPPHQRGRPGPATAVVRDLDEVSDLGKANRQREPFAGQMGRSP